MIIGIGCDIVEHELTEKLNWLSDKDLINRIFSEREKIFLDRNSSIKFISGRFAAKEAVLKCLGVGMYDGIALSDVEILQLESGKPIVELSDNLAEVSSNLKANNIHVNITHSDKYSLAVAIAEGT